MSDPIARRNRRGRIMSTSAAIIDNIGVPQRQELRNQSAALRLPITAMISNRFEWVTSERISESDPWRLLSIAGKRRNV